MRLANPISLVTEPVVHGIHGGCISSYKILSFLILLRLFSAERAAEWRCSDRFGGLSEETSLVQLRKPSAADLSLRAAPISKTRDQLNTSKRHKVKENSTMVDHDAASIDAQWSKLLPRDQ